MPKMEIMLTKLIADYVAAYPARKGIRNYWQRPLLGFADAADPRFFLFKEQISPSHAVPQDFLPDARTVIAFFIPFEKEIISSNTGGRNASREWACAYVETNRLISDVNLMIKEKLIELGYRSTVIPATHNFDEKTLLSDWSHRHVAYLAGLGNFGLNNMLITAKGCCGRIGSLVTNLCISPTPLIVGESCLYKDRGLCRACVKRCVHAALTVDGFNRHACYEMCLENAALFPEIGLADVCGKCLAGMPCSATNPVSVVST